MPTLPGQKSADKQPSNRDPSQRRRVRRAGCGKRHLRDGQRFGSWHTERNATGPDAFRPSLGSGARPAFMRDTISPPLRPHPSLFAPAQSPRALQRGGSHHVRCADRDER
jgi:hypothetical protein